MDMKDLKLTESEVLFLNRCLEMIIKAGPQAEELAKQHADGSYTYAFGFVGAQTRTAAETIQDFLKEKGALK